MGFQRRVRAWMRACFGEEIARDRVERNHRFLEEALELVQSLACTKSEAKQLVEYVYSRPQGDVSQEVGGVMVTLAALCGAAEINMHQAGETELERIWTKIDVIREKQAAKPKHSPLPIAVPSEPYGDGGASKALLAIRELVGAAEQAGWDLTENQVVLDNGRAALADLEIVMADADDEAEAA